MKEKFFLIALLLCWKKKVGKSGKGIYDMMEIIPPRKNPIVTFLEGKNSLKNTSKRGSMLPLTLANTSFVDFADVQGNDP